MDTDNHYQYTPLSGPRTTRLVMLHASETEDAPLACELIEASIDDPPAYDALSYTWNNESPSEPMTVVNSTGTSGPSSTQTLLLTPNCAAALRILRKRIGRKRSVAKAGLWVDAVCINQSSNSEKSVQVALMAEIYRCAEIVVVWLGEDYAPPDVRSTLLIQLLPESWKIEYYRPDIQWLEAISDYSLSVVRRICKKYSPRAIQLMDAPYWSRVWTLQEFAHLCPQLLCRNSETVQFRRLKGIDTVGSMHVHMGLFRRLHRGFLLEAAISGSIQEVLQMNASEPRDKVFALREVFSSDLDELRVDYDLPVEHVFREATKLVLMKSGNLEILYHTCEPSHFKSMSSWAVDWTASEKDFDERDWYFVYEKANACLSAETSLSFTYDGQRLNLCGGRISTVSTCVSDTLHDRTTTTIGKDFEDKMIAFFSAVAESSMLARKDLASGIRNTMEFYDDEWSLVDMKNDPMTLCELLKGKRYALCSTSFRGRKLFLSSDGRVGLGNRNILPGDLICVFAGLTAPFVVRPQGPHYSLVSPTILDGAMWGEMWPDDESKLETWEIV